MMSFKRWLKHGFTTPNAVRRAFPPSALERIQQAIAESEATHSGEIRFAVESALPWSYLKRDAPPRQRAAMVFSKLRVWDTEFNNGVLIYVDLADRAIEIVADRGIAQQVPPADWQAICDAMRTEFRAGNYADGVVAGVAQVGARLAAHFPLAPQASNPNELPNAPTLL
jgi:uncharacterized membrane protein